MFDKYDLTTVRKPVMPTCMTVTSKKHPLKAYKANGWYAISSPFFSQSLKDFREIWSPAQRPDKIYYRSNSPGSRITFELFTGEGVGEVGLTFLKSKTFGMGSAWVWKSTPGELITVDGKEEEQTEDNMKFSGRRADGWWDVDGVSVIS
jgi:hypothetical protein